MPTAPGKTAARLWECPQDRKEAVTNPPITERAGSGRAKWTEAADTTRQTAAVSPLGPERSPRPLWTRTGLGHTPWQQAEAPGCGRLLPISLPRGCRDTLGGGPGSRQNKVQTVPGTPQGGPRVKTAPRRIPALSFQLLLWAPKVQPMAGKRGLPPAGAGCGVHSELPVLGAQSEGLCSLPAEVGTFVSPERGPC